MKKYLLILCLGLQHVILLSGQSSSIHATSQSLCKTVQISELEFKMIKAGLVNIKKIIPDVILDIRYATENNFLKVNVYGNYDQCYLQPDVAKRLLIVDSTLKSIKPGWKLVMFDCARPVSVQWKMWQALKMPAAEKGKYVSNPKNLSVHNLGAAVDLSLADANGKYLDMGTDFDYFGNLAYPFCEPQLVREGKLTNEQVDNRKVLRVAMKKAGFSNVPYEWWHFNAYSRNIATSKYQRID